MKKVLSIALALIMALSAMVMLIPTASAESKVDPIPGAGGKVFYEEDFNNAAWADLVDKDLFSEIGWGGSLNDGTTMLIEEGENGDNQLRIVAQYHNDGMNVPYTGTTGTNKWYGGGTYTVVQNPLMAKNSLTVEYKFTYQRRVAGAANNLTVTTKDGTEKTVLANGQGNYQMAAFCFSNITNKNGGSQTAEVFLPRINLSGVSSNSFKGWNDASHAAWAWKSAATQNVEKMNFNPDTPKIAFEYQDDPATIVTTQFDNICDIEHSVKFIIDPHNATYSAFVDGVLWEQLTPSWGDDWGNADWEYFVSDTISMWVKPGMDVLLDDIKIAEYVPELAISEMMLNGTRANATGKYQYVELYNPSDVAVNVYDYALHISNGGSPKATVGDQTDLTTDSWGVGGGSVLGYFYPGANTLDRYTDAGATSATTVDAQVFDNPAYADAVLQPGETAVVLIPQTAMKGGTAVTDEAFVAYLKTLNADFDAPVFVCHNETYNFTLGLLTNESCFVNLLKVKNGGTAEAVALADGKGMQYLKDYSVFTAVVSSKHNTSGTGFNGGNTLKSCFGQFLPAAGTSGVFGLAENKSYEIAASGWLADHASSSLGFQKYAANEARKDANDADVYATPGFVPVDCRRIVGVNLNGTAAAGTIGMAFTGTATAPVAKPGFAIHQIVNGVVVNDNVTPESEVTVAIPAEEMTNALDYNLTFEYYAVDPQILRSRVSADKDTIQLIAGVNDLDLAEDTVGFNIMLVYGEQEGMMEYECQYVYKSLYEVNSELVRDNNYYDGVAYDWLFAVSIVNVPTEAEVATPLTIYVEAVRNGEASAQGAMKFEYTIPAAPAAAE